MYPNTTIFNRVRTLTVEDSTYDSSFVLNVLDFFFSRQLGLHTCLPPMCTVAQSKAIFLAMFLAIYTVVFVSDARNCTS